MRNLGDQGGREISEGGVDVGRFYEVKSERYLE